MGVQTLNVGAGEAGASAGLTAGVFEDGGAMSGPDPDLGGATFSGGAAPGAGLGPGSVGGC